MDTPRPSPRTNRTRRVPHLVPEVRVGDPGHSHDLRADVLRAGGGSCKVARACEAGVRHARAAPGRRAAAALRAPARRTSSSRAQCSETRSVSSATVACGVPVWCSACSITSAPAHGARHQSTPGTASPCEAPGGKAGLCRGAEPVQKASLVSTVTYPNSPHPLSADAFAARVHVGAADGPAGSRTKASSTNVRNGLPQTCAPRARISMETVPTCQLVAGALGKSAQRRANGAASRRVRREA